MGKEERDGRGEEKEFVDRIMRNRKKRRRGARARRLDQGREGAAAERKKCEGGRIVGGRQMGLWK